MSGCVISHRRVDGGTNAVAIHRLRDVAGNQAHLVVGRTGALLVDAMAGIGDLPAVVADVTALPITIVLTHGHNDHVGGAYWYRDAYLAACEATPERVVAEEGLAATAHAAQIADGSIAADTPWALRDGARPTFGNVAEGDVFDLGGVTVSAHALPGHTAGSMGYLVREARVLLTGDAVTPTMCLFFDNSATVSEWRATLAHMARLPFDVFYTGHQDRAFAREALADFDALGAFVENDRGSEWAHNVFEQFHGRVHVYRGIDPDADDFLALIERETPETRERARRLRAEARAGRAARRCGQGRKAW